MGDSFLSGQIQLEQAGYVSELAIFDGGKNDRKVWLLLLFVFLKEDGFADTL